MTARETYIENIKLELDGLNDQLGSFETKVTHTRQDARERYAAELAKLRLHSRDALVKWEALETSSDASWHQWVSDMDRTRDAFIHAFHAFKARLRRRHLQFRAAGRGMRMGCARWPSWWTSTESCVPRLRAGTARVCAATDRAHELVRCRTVKRAGSA